MKENFEGRFFAAVLTIAFWVAAVVLTIKFAFALGWLP